MALEAEPPSRPIPLLWFSDLGAQDRPQRAPGLAGLPGEVQSTPLVAISVASY